VEIRPSSSRREKHGSGTKFFHKEGKKILYFEQGEKGNVAISYQKERGFQGIAKAQIKTDGIEVHSSKFSLNEKEVPINREGKNGNR